MPFAWNRSKHMMKFAIQVSNVRAITRFIGLVHGRLAHDGEAIMPCLPKAIRRFFVTIRLSSWC